MIFHGPRRRPIRFSAARANFEKVFRAFLDAKSSSGRTAGGQTRTFSRIAPTYEDRFPSLKPAVSAIPGSLCPLIFRRILSSTKRGRIPRLLSVKAAPKRRTVPSAPMYAISQVSGCVARMKNGHKADLLVVRNRANFAGQGQIQTAGNSSGHGARIPIEHDNKRNQELSESAQHARDAPIDGLEKRQRAAPPHREQGEEWTEKKREHLRTPHSKNTRETAASGLNWERKIRMLPKRVGLPPRLGRARPLTHRKHGNSRRRRVAKVRVISRVQDSFVALGVC